MLYPEHSKGCASELKAAIYFLEQGHQVYLPLVQQGRVDFIVEKFESQQLARMQVKTATWNLSSGHKYLQCRTQTTNKDKRLPSDMDYEFLVIVYENEMWVIPSERVTSSNISLKGKEEHVWDTYKVKGELINGTS